MWSSRNYNTKHAQEAKDSTAIILQNLHNTRDCIENNEIPEYVGGETILWFEYDGEIYTVYDLSYSLLQQYLDYQDSINSFYPSASPPRRQHHTTSSREGSSEQPSSSRGGKPRPSNGGHYDRARSL